MTRTPNARPAWRFAALWRRWLFLLLIVVPSILAASYMSALLPGIQNEPWGRESSRAPPWIAKQKRQIATALQPMREERPSNLRQGQRRIV